MAAGLAAVALLMALNQSWLVDWSLDGQYVLTNIRTQNWFRNVPWGVDWNPLQGLGGAWYPFSAWFFPAALAGQLAGGETPHQVALLAFVSAELWIGTAYLARSAGAGRWTACAAGAVLIVAVIPLAGRQPIYPILNLSPLIGSIMAGSAVTVGAFLRPWAGAGWRGLARAALSIALPVAMMIVAPTLPSIVVPGIALLIVAPLFGPAPDRWLKWAAIAVMAVLLAAGPLPVSAGLLLWTPAVAFGADFDGGKLTLAHGSVLFHGTYPGGKVFFLAAMAGAALAALFSPSLRRFACICLAVQAVMVAASLAVTVISNWSGPQITYFEFVLWPAYAVAICLGGEVAAATLRHNPRARRAVALITCAALAWVWLGRPVNPSRMPWPPSSPPIVDRLAEDLAIGEQREFRGRVINVAGSAAGSAVPWIGQSGFDSHLTLATGNDHRLVGLWYFGIPTLEEYSSTAQPELHQLAGQFLVSPGQKLLRNILTFSEAEGRLLPLLGVSRAITDHAAPESPVLAQQDGPGGTKLSLVSVPGANVGDWSPTEAIVAQDAAAVISAMKDPAVDLRRTVFVHQAIAPGLVPAQAARVTMQRSGFHVRASSAGRSLLLLPFGYSRCFEITATATPVILHRADLALMAIEFEGNLDARLTFNYSPLRNSWCRLQDREDLRALNFGSRR